MSSYPGIDYSASGGPSPPHQRLATSPSLAPSRCARRTRPTSFFDGDPPTNFRWRLTTLARPSGPDPKGSAMPAAVRSVANGSSRLNEQSGKRARDCRSCLDAAVHERPRRTAAVPLHHHWSAGQEAHGLGQSISWRRLLRLAFRLPERAAGPANSLGTLPHRVGGFSRVTWLPRPNILLTCAASQAVRLVGT